MSAQRSLWVLAGISAVALLALALHAPIPQDPGYHAFADQRSFFGIPNFWNVVSNLPFVLVGVAGLRALSEDHLPGIVRSLYPAYATFFGAAMLIAVGSAYYHLNPDNSTLTWDRLPMTLGFMAFVAIILGEHVSADLARRALLPLLLLGVLSVLYWSFTESSGHGDLRPYFAVQFLPILLIPLVLVFIPSVLSNVFYLWMVVASYAGAKILEVLDERIYSTSFVISGHTLKHLLAAVGMYLVVLAMRRRGIQADRTVRPMKDG